MKVFTQLASVTTGSKTHSEKKRRSKGKKNEGIKRIKQISSRMKRKTYSIKRKN
jgi:hypothetical protein